MSDIDKAIQLIGQTPTLEFRLAKPGASEIIHENLDASVDKLCDSTGIPDDIFTCTSQFDPIQSPTERLL